MGICALYVFLYFVKPFESPKALYKFPINPFTAILAAPSLGNRPVKSAKSVRERNSIKMHSIESRFVTGPLNTVLKRVYVHFPARKFYRLWQ